MPNRKGQCTMETSGIYMQFDGLRTVTHCEVGTDTTNALCKLEQQHQG